MRRYTQPIIHEAQYEVALFLWSHAKLVQQLDKKAVDHYGFIASTLMSHFWDGWADTKVFLSSQAISMWLDLVIEPAKMGFEYGALETYDTLSLGKRKFQQPLEYVDINKPYLEMGWFLYEKLSALGSANRYAIKTYGMLIFALQKRKDRGFDAHLAPGYLDDLLRWIRLYKQKSPKASTYGQKIFTKYDFFRTPYKHKDFVERRTHEAEHELNYFLWSRIKLCDVTKPENIRQYRELTTQLSNAFKNDKLKGTGYRLASDLTVALEQLETFPYFGHTLLATIDGYEYPEMMARLYNLPAQYINIEQPIIETARFFYEKISSLQPGETKIAASFIAPLTLFAEAKDSGFARQLPGFLPRLLACAQSVVAGKIDKEAMTQLKIDFPKLFN